nr:transposase [Streptomyces finlayi]
MPARMRTTKALRRAAGAAVCDGSRTVVQAGRDLHLSWPIVQRCFEDYAAKALPEQPPATEAIGIDETRRGKPVWKQNPDTDKWELVADAWHIGFVDAIGGRGLFGQVEGRNATPVTDWLMAQPAAWRAQVRYVAIDLCSTFRAAIHRALPHAAVVVDCFHIVQLAQRHLADLRPRLTWKQHGRRSRKGDGIYTVRKLLRRNKEDLGQDQLAVLKSELECMGTYGRQIHAAWQAKELLRDLLSLAVTRTHVCPDHSAISGRPLPLPRPYRRPCPPPRTPRTGRDRRAVVERHRDLPDHRDHQRRLRRQQPPHQAGGPQRLRLPQPSEPTPPLTLRDHPPEPARGTPP